MFSFFFFNDTATTEIYTLSLHDALPICRHRARPLHPRRCGGRGRRSRRVPDSRLRGREAVRLRWGALRRLRRQWGDLRRRDRKSTRLNSSHSQISYAVFCLKKKTSSAWPPSLGSCISSFVAGAAVRTRLRGQRIKRV